MSNNVLCCSDMWVFGFVIHKFPRFHSFADTESDFINLLKYILCLSLWQGFWLSFVNGNVPLIVLLMRWWWVQVFTMCIVRKLPTQSVFGFTEFTSHVTKTWLHFGNGVLGAVPSGLANLKVVFNIYYCAYWLTACFLEMLIVLEQTGSICCIGWLRCTVQEWSQIFWVTWCSGTDCGTLRTLMAMLVMAGTLRLLKISLEWLLHRD